MAWEAHQPGSGATLRPLPPGANVGTRRFPVAPRFQSADFRARIALPSANRLRRGLAEVRRGTRRHRAEIQFAGASRNSTGGRIAGASHHDHADFGGPRRRTENVQESGKLHWNYRSTGTNVREID